MPQATGAQFGVHPGCPVGPLLLLALRLTTRTVEAALLLATATLTLPEYLISAHRRVRRQNPPALAYAYSDTIAWSASRLERLTGALLNAVEAALRTVPAVALAVPVTITALGLWLSMTL